MRKLAIFLISGAFALTSATAHAELPDPVRAMIEAAIENGDPDAVKTVADLARQTNPDDAEEINRIVAAFNDEQAQLAAEQKQEEIEEIRSAGLFDNWSGQGELGLSYSTGNSEETGITLGLKLARDGIDWHHKIRATVDYEETDGKKTDEQYLVGYEFNYDLSDRIFAFGLVQYERDPFQGFKSRYSAGGGLGYHIIMEDHMTLSAKAGPGWRHTENTDGTSDSSVAGLIAADFDWHITDNITFTEDIEIILESENNTYTSITGLTAGIAADLKARLGVKVEHDTNPPAGKKKTETDSTLTLIYDF